MTRLLRSVPLGARLGAGFAALVAALALVAVVAAGALKATDATGTNTQQGRAVEALRVLDTVGQGVYANAHDVVRHLYVYDGDLKTQDSVAKEIDVRRAQVSASMKRLGTLVTSPDGRRALADLVTARDALTTASDEAVRLSRQETIDQVEERDGSRGTYTDKVVPALAPLSKALASFSAAAGKASRDAAQASADTSASGRRTVIGVALVAALLAAALAFLITRSVTGPMSVLVDRLRTVREQDLADLQTGLGAMAEGDLTVAAEARTAPGHDGSRDEIGAASRTVDELIAGVHDAVGAYDGSRERLGGLIGTVARSAADVSAGSQQVAASSVEAGRAVIEIAGASTEVARGAEHQRDSAETARASATGVSDRIQGSAAAAQETKATAGHARDVVREGIGAAQEATRAVEAVAGTSAAVADAIRDLAGKSEEIGKIVDTITGIAEQTNLLALNAAIEAARAGDQGRGFAVVADEVRKLAEESQGSAAEISRLLGGIQDQTRSTVELVDEGTRSTREGAATVQATSDAFARIGDAVDEVDARIGEIAAAALQVSAETTRMLDEVAGIAGVAEQSSAVAEEVSASTEQTSAATQEIATSAQQLAATAAELERLVGTFKLAA